MFDYFNNLSEECGKNIELDVVALCCDYSEYKDLEEYLRNYEHEHKQTENENDKDFYKRIEEEINDKTTLIKFSDNLDDGFIIQNF